MRKLVSVAARQAAMILLAGAAAACSTSSYEDISKAPAAEAVPIFDSKIVPGHRIGPVSIGMATTQLYRTLGEPTKTQRFADKTSYEFRGPGLSVLVLEKTQKVITVSPTSPGYETPEGVHLQSSDLAAHAAYPNAKWKTDEIGGSGFCDTRGMKLLTLNGVVASITVWSPGC